MEPEGVPALVEALFIYSKAEIMLDKRTKAALRLCNKHFKNLIDATITAARIKSRNLNDALNALLHTEWHDLETLKMKESLACRNRLQELPSALFVKFSRLETLKIDHCVSLKTLPEEIEKLSHLKSLELTSCYSLTDLPYSLGQLTTLEKIDLWDCLALTTEGIAPLQHLTGLKSLWLVSCDKLHKYLEFICNFPLLKELKLYSHFIKTLPGALGNLTNLEFVEIGLPSLTELPESIGNLNNIKILKIYDCLKLTTLPESLDDLLWRKAHETGESKMERVDFSGISKSKFSLKMKQTLKLMKRNGVIVHVGY